MADAAGQLAEMVEHPKQSQPNPGLRADESSCNLISGRKHRSDHRVRGWERGGLQRICHDPSRHGHGLRGRDGPGHEPGQAREET